MLIMIAAAIGGAAGIFGSIAYAVTRYVLGPDLTGEQRLALLEKSKASLKAQLDLLKLKSDRMELARIPLAKLSELEEETGILFTDYALQPGVLFKTGEGSCVAYSAVCTHLGCTVQTALLDGQIFCPCHQSYFDLRSGAPLEGPATIALPQEPIAIDGDAVYLVKPKEPLKIGPNQIEMQIM